MEGRRRNWIQTAIGLFAQPHGLLSPSYLWMLRDILTFNQQSVADYKAGRLAGITLGEYFRRNHFAAPAHRLSGTDGRRDLVGAGGRDARFSCRELRRVLQQPPPAAI
jgi:hypothetical protein